MNRFCLSILTLLFFACSYPVSLSPLPQQINGYDVVYERAYLDGPARGGSVWESDGTKPVVLLEVMEDLDPEIQWLILLHELCHLEGMSSELGADCCAGTKFSKLGINMGNAAIYLLNRSYTDEVHPPGATRALIFTTCFATENQ